MKHLSLCIFTSFALISVAACSHPASQDTKSETVRSETVEASTREVESNLVASNAGTPAAAAPTPKKAECVSESFCTREYAPTTCKFMGKDFASANPCEAKKLARAYACQEGAKYDERQVVCKANKAQ